MTKFRIALLVTPESTASTLFGLYDLFNSVNRDWRMLSGESGESPFVPMVVARRKGTLTVANGVTVRADCSMTALADPDIICVPDLHVSPEAPLDKRLGAERRWLRDCHARGATVAAACSGALLLAEAGLLDGQDATTHWAYCDALARRYPTVRVHPERSLVITGEGHRLLMAGGGTSWQDLALFLIARHAGLEQARQVARLYLIDWHEHGQQPYALLSYGAQRDDPLIRQCQAWLAEHYDSPAPVAGMCRLSGLSERSFKRRFRQCTGLTPIHYVHLLRLEEAKQWLETASEPIESVAAAVGYEDPSFFSRLFRREVGMTPAQYRRRFGALYRLSAHQGSSVIPGSRHSASSARPESVT